MEYLIYIIFTSEQCRPNRAAPSKIVSKPTERSHTKKITPLEIQRVCNLLSQNLFHRTIRDVELNGYTLPKYTTVVPQISCGLLEEKIFPEPNRFNPERLLDKNGQLLKIEQLVPFSIGKRICLGESLARMKLFLFIANIFHTFKVSIFEFR
ncbi:cytochrome p450 domain-containing protein [Ditylenchus destructor]|nr:cytochrome p450 domain-containing protein [Ditylenchus destructor]